MVIYLFIGSIVAKCVIKSCKNIHDSLPYTDLWVVFSCCLKRFLFTAKKRFYDFISAQKQVFEVSFIMKYEI